MDYRGQAWFDSYAKLRQDTEVSIFIGPCRGTASTLAPYFVNRDRRGVIMEIDFDQVELGLVGNLTILGEALKSLSIDGKRWWIASDPHYALTTMSEAATWLWSPPYHLCPVS
jgi:hypothetical protein